MIFNVVCGKANNLDVASLEALEFGAHQELPYPTKQKKLARR